jgi:pimeloyl-ACP methyl ester carboxylesterase
VFERLPDLVDADRSLVRRGRFFTATFLVEVGATAYLIHVREGRVDRVERGPFLMREHAFAVRASEEAWRRFWEPLPAPGYHDIFAMARHGHARIEGDLVPLMANLRYVKDLLALPRASGPSLPPPAAGDHDASPRIEPVTGRYVHLTLQGRAHRVYFEEAGAGIPLLCLHTAGADGRQFRHLMNDEAVTRHYRVIAFDMPRHGKSLPPVGWQDEEYQLTTEGYTDFIMRFVRALGLDRPVALGCSIGGKIVLQLALDHAREFRALVGVESAAYQPPWYDDTSWLHRPDVHSEVSGALMSGLIAPQSPGETRWDTLWMYMQGGPGVFKGDLFFYRADGDFRDRVGRIDTSQCPLYLLTGEYDFSCTPEDTRLTAEKIAGASLTVMREIGHFPMSENPAKFREYILPVLDEIRLRSAAQGRAG